MVENVEFEDGDFIQTYQVGGGVQVQLLRYMGMAMSFDELIASDWPVALSVQPMELTQVSGFPAQGVRIFQVLDASGYPVRAEGSELKDGQQMLEIELVMIHADGAVLICQSSRALGADGALPDTTAMQVLPGDAAVNEEAEVG